MNEVLPKNLKRIISEGEGISVEFKSATKSLPANLFETVCSMLNRNGGHIFLGVNDAGEVIGLYKDYIKQMKKEFVDLCNNPEKIFPTIHLDIKEYICKNKHILYIFVHESSDVHKTVNRIYDRNEDGDFDITNNTSLVSDLYIRKRNTYIENKIYPYATLDDLRQDLINTARIMATNKDANHPWSTMTNEELLRSAGLYEKNLETGEFGINLAGILIFGKDEVINSALSYYKTDAILRVKDLDRYDDRDDIRTNLIDAYKRLIDFTKKHLNDKFYLEGNQRISVRDKITRELCANLLIHREYSNPYPAKLIITKNEIITENANKPRVIGYINLNDYAPYPKNPKIASFFKEIGYADELGSGIRKIAKYTKIYSGGTPEFKDGDIFMAKIPLFVDDLILENINKIVRDLVYNFIKENNGVDRKQIDNYVVSKISVDVKMLRIKVRTSLTYLKTKKLITNVGTDAKPKWIVYK